MGSEHPEGLVHGTADGSVEIRRIRVAELFGPADGFADPPGVFAVAFHQGVHMDLAVQRIQRVFGKVG